MDFTFTIGHVLTLVAISIGLWQLRMVNIQIKNNFFADYTKRYQEIMLNFPESVNDKDFNLADLDDEERAKFLRYARAYFDLCSEEYYLYQKKRISKEIWLEWKSGIEYAFSKPAFIQAWGKIHFDTKFYSEFHHFVNDITQK
ncbi:MAG: hypothetical protein OCD76_03165 [Reichenbachiella sp.]